MKYRIVNRRRFIIFCTIVILLYTGVMSVFFSVVSSHDSEELRIMEVEVQPGDTLWELAKVYGPDDKDIRETVYDICSLNGIKASELQSGQIIKIQVD